MSRLKFSPDRLPLGQVLVCLLALASFLAPLDASAGEAESFGEPLTLEETTTIAEILADPAAYEGRRVRVEGRVKDVCPMKGCWMDLVPSGADAEGPKMRVKVQDDVIVFPAEAKGSVAVAEGIVEVIEMDRDRYVSWLAHEAEERGETFDPSTVGEGPFQWVQVKGEGARLQRQ